jgi:putative selenium metabolism hydrolase
MQSDNIETEVVEFLQELVRAPGIAGDLSAVAEVAARRMRLLGFDEVWQDAVGNVIGRRGGALPGPKLVFDAHMDTVEVGEREAWVHDPFGGVLSQGKIWGRGSVDDKGSLAAFTVALASLPREAMRGEVYAVGTVGEELIEGAALESVLDEVRPDGVIIGEPTDCRLGIGHKGRLRLVFSIHGKAAHSSSPEVGDNAIDKAVEVIRRVRRIPPVEDPLLGKSVMEPIQLITSPYPSASTIPYACEIVFDRRLVRGETVESVLDMHQETLNGMDGSNMYIPQVVVDCYTGKRIVRQDYHPAWSVDPGSEWVRLALEGLKSAGIPPVTYGTPFCTNGSGSAGERGLPTLVFGPCSVHQAHVTDEHAEVSELVRAVHGYIELAQALGRLNLQVNGA